MDVSLAVMYGTRSIIVLLCRWQSTGVPLRVAHLGPPNMVSALVFRCADLVRRYELDEEEYFRAMEALLIVYEERSGRALRSSNPQHMSTWGREG